MKKEIRSLLRSKAYLVILLVSAIAAYAYGITHSAIDIDDTAIPLYFQQGLAPYVHRWTLFTFFHLFHIPVDFQYTALVDGISVFFLCCSVTVWCSLWKWLLDRYVQLPPFLYGLVAAVFITNPIITEVFIYFLHNGICIAYGFTGLALYFFLGSTGQKGRKRILSLAGATFLLALAVGCYESFLLVFVMGAFLAFILIQGFLGEEEGKDGFPVGKVAVWFFHGVIIAAGTLLIRVLMYHVCKLMYDPGVFEEYDVTYRAIFGDNFIALSELGMTLKRYISAYHLAGMMYLPVALLVLSRIVILCTGLYAAFARKKITVFFATAVLLFLPPFMAVFEGTVTKFRSAQYIPMLSAFAVLLAMAFLFRHFGEKKRLPGYLLLVAGLVLVILQCAEMNKWFSVNYQKHEWARETMMGIAEDLKNGDYDLSKPIVIFGNAEVPVEIASRGAISYNSGAFRIISMLTDPIDPHWKEKFYRSYGYVYDPTPGESILAWGMGAFNHTDEQLIKLWEMLGCTGFTAADTETIKKARQVEEEILTPSGYSGYYIYENEEFLLVNIE